MRPSVRSENVEPCARTDLPELADMHCPCGFEAGEHPAWRRRYCRNRRYPEHGAVSPCVLCGYISPRADRPPRVEGWWLCPNDPRCPHGAALHDVDDLDDPSPRCCFEGCTCGRRADA